MQNGGFFSVERGGFFSTKRGVFSYSPTTAHSALKRLWRDCGLVKVKKACWVICSCIPRSKKHHAKLGAPHGQASLLGFNLDLLTPGDLLC